MGTVKDVLSNVENYYAEENNVTQMSASYKVKHAAHGH